MVASVAPDFSLEVHNLILAPPAVSSYSTLREQLIKHMAAIEQHQLQQLLNTEELCDRKPMQLLCQPSTSWP